ncbi:hypothetical protein DXG03_003095 [Asterophora parasitica]|uniref:Uncharacterized protein n=1 Tax=Asterophora parasitica TaxID=117018 RepID=A0A9P7GF55_9AGAR|nr:hypothetical protein DXG03_003095 [Asterophora parasitica]
MLWAYPWKEYKRRAGVPATSIWQPLLDWNGKSYRASMDGGHPDFGQTFGVTGNGRVPMRRGRTRAREYLESPTTTFSGEMQIVGSSFDLSSPPPYKPGDETLAPPRHPDLSKKDFVFDADDAA